MLFDDPTFYYSMALQSLINYISGTIVFIPIYFKLRQENYKRNLRITALGWYIINAILGALGLSIYKNVYHQIAPLYLSLGVALIIIIIMGILGFTYAGIGFNFFTNPSKLETRKVAVGMIISVLGILLAITLFL